MLRQLLKTSLPLIIYNPVGVREIEYCAVCARSGALPVFDTEFSASRESIDFIKELSRKDFNFGIRVSVKSDDIISYIRENIIKNCDTVVYYYDTLDDLSDFEIGKSPYTSLIEVTDININEKLDAIEPHGLILRGHEAPGKVSLYTSFILQQWYTMNSGYSYLIHGGVGYFTASGMFAAGASGVVLDSQLYLSEEAPISPSFKHTITKLEERDSVILEDGNGIRRRFFSKLGTKIVREMKQKSDSGYYRTSKTPLYDEIKENIVFMDNDNAEPMQGLFYLGQDAAIAQYFARKSNSLVGMVHGFFEHVNRQLSLVDEFDPVHADSALSLEHGTKYPLMQGPMANISDSPEFARKVSEAGALPFFAMGNLPVNLADEMVKKGKKNPVLATGMIGVKAFNRYLEEHMEIVKKHKVPFALFAGGIPSQVKELEEAGTKTYLHTPSRSMLENAIASGCTRFILEGHEAGGHIGFLTSMTLWELALQAVYEMPDEQVKEFRIIFAGGIGTPCASHFISGMSAMFAARGCKIGMQVGTPYLFTKEIVETGAITQLYQDIICKENKTIVIGDTVGLHARTVESPFSKRIIENEEARVRDKVPLNERKERFEDDNIGSLLISAKTFCPDFSDPDDVKLVYYDEKDQYEKGNFLTGDLLTCYETTITIDDVHNTIMHNKHGLFENLNRLEILFGEKGIINDDIAIIGMGCIYPQSKNPKELWENILAKKYTIKEMPVERFDPELYFDEDKKAEDKSYTKIAGYIDDFVFNYEKYGYTETEAQSISRSQQMVLETAFQAVEDAGYLGEEKKLPANRTAVILGTCLTSELNSDLQVKYYYPEFKYYLDHIDEFKELSNTDKKKLLADFKEGLGQGHSVESPDGVVLSLEASRIANHLGLRGANYTIDAACASSLAALDAAQKELLSGFHDVAIVGGVNTNLAPESFVGFCQMGALSGKGSYPFDQRAEGFVLGEGAGVIVIKRMKDALRDGDTIHGILRGMGSSSDGKGKAIAAPNPDGQFFAFERCFDDLNGEITPDDIGFIEAHGTSTLMGDLAEIQTLRKIYGNVATLGFSSVKSQIGHLLGGAGLAGVIKAILVLKHKTLAPNANYEKLSSRFDLSGTNLYVVKEQKQWDTEGTKPRRAGVSSFGFGGINYHCIFEEMGPAYSVKNRPGIFDPSRNYDDRRIVIAGMGVALPGAQSPDEMWDVIRDGKNVLSDIPEDRFHSDYYTNEEDEWFKLPEVKAGIVDMSTIDTKSFRMTPNTARTVDRSQFIGLHCAKQALEQSGLIKKLEKGNKTAVIVGTMSGEKLVENIIRTRLGLIKRILEQSKAADKSTRSRISDKLVSVLKDRFMKNNEDTVPGLLSNIVSGRIANFFGCNGANYIVDASSASSAISMRLAMMGLRVGEYENVITGGIDSNLTPPQMRALKAMGMLTREGAVVFDTNGKGINLSEGGALFVMTTLKNAREQGMPVLGELNVIGISGQAKDNMLLPSEGAYVESMEQAYRLQTIAKRDIDYIDVYGSGYMLFDQMEYQALNRIYKKDVPFGNSKPEFGYFRSSNPAVVLAKMLLMNREQVIPAVKTYSKKTSIVKENSSLQAVQSAMDLIRPWRHFAANLFGIGGNHGHMIMSTPPLRLLPQTHKQQEAVPVAVSMQREQVQLNDSFTVINGSHSTALLSGQGSQHSGMMKELYEKDTRIRKTMDRGNEIFRITRGYDLLDIMFGDSDKINLTENTQPAIFISTAAVYDVLKEAGFNPKYFIGHSLGEFSALYCAGILNFEDTMQLLLKRSELMKEAANKVAGRIMVVFKNWIETEELIKKSGIQDLYVANKNSETQTSISGKENSILEFSVFLKSTNTMYKALSLSGAFHSPLFDSAASKLREHMKSVNFNNVDYSRVISNVTARPYPQNQDEVKDLLAQQLVSPVEFVNSVHYAFNHGAGSFIEAGPNKILINLLKNISLDIKTAIPSVDPKVDEAKTLDEAVKKIGVTENRVSPASASSAKKVNIKTQEPAMPQVNYSEISKDKEFNEFLNEKKDHVNRLLFEEYQKYQQQKAFEESKKFGFYTGPIVVAGMSIGLPGSARDVFGEDNFDRILRGENCIELLSKEERDLMLDKNITKVHKNPDGSAAFIGITEDKEVIHLFGKPGRFNKDNYGIEFTNDISDALCLAAGIEALRDANIPLVPNRKNTSTGGVIIDGFALPVEMQGTTGVIRTSILAGLNSVIDEVTRYLGHKHVNGPFKDFEKLYYTLMEQIKDESLKEQITDWFFELKSQIKKSDYAFDKNFVFKLGFMGAAQFAQLIKAKGPNTQSNAACSSTTQAIAIAEDWIRMGRCERVIIIGSESATEGQLAPWLQSIFLALGAGTIKNDINEAAKPFDAKRNGTIVGSGAVSLIIERADTVQSRGLRGQAELLGTHMGNSAFHGTSIDVNHVSEEMKKGLTMIEARHGLKKEEYTKSLVFMSHETYTPAKGGSASAEVKALRESYPEHYKNILISNTKGFTGHTLGGGIEDPVLIKALQKGIVPPIANLKEIPQEFSDLTFSRGETGTYEYGMHFAAGFGSQLAMALFRRIDEISTVNNRQYYDWLKRVSGYEEPELIIENRTLRIKQQKEARPAAKPVPGPAAEIQLPETVDAQAPATSTAAPAIGRGHLTENLKSVIAEQTGYTVDMLEDDLDLEADLGIDTVKQVEIFGRISSHFNLEVPEDLKLSDMNTIAKLVDYIASKVGSEPVSGHAAVPAQASDIKSISNDLKSVIAEQTGYTVDMLEDDLDLEADLGIDTVKQVEIFGRISSHFNLEVPEDLKLSDLNTIAKLVDYISSQVGPVEAPAVLQVQAAASSSGSASITNDLKSVIAEQTGYTVDMLEDDLDLEADLGIDTVKQVEIFGRISSHFNLEVPEDLKLSDMNTIAKLVDYIASKVEPVPASTGPLEIPAAVSAYPSDSIVKDLKSVIAEQTGYTVDMLEDDLDLEADLGIDTVKQVEIFGRVSSHFNLEVPEDLKLSDMNTIARLAEYIAGKLAPAEAPAAAQPQAGQTVQAVADAPAADDVHRFVVKLSGLSGDTNKDSDFSGRVFLMTRDSQGFADKLSSSIIKKAGKVVSIGMDEKADYQVDLTKPDGLEKKLEEIAKKYNDINSFIHLAPIDYVANDTDRSDECIRASVKSFFVIVKTLHQKLRTDRSVIATPSFNSVVFPYGEAGKKMYPVFGALGGMSKTIQKEFTDARVKIVDFAVDSIKKSITSILKNFEQELLCTEKRVEVGYDKDQRFGLSIKTQAPVATGSLIKDGDRIIVTGGAAGITFEILKKLTATYMDLDLHILDISDIYSLNEAFRGSSVTEKDVLEVVKSMMQGAKPLEIKQAVTRVMRTRQVINNMEHLKQMGAKVTYHVADVTSLKAIKDVLSNVKSFNGIFHAAGMEQSQFIEKKALEQFNLVFDVKVMGALNLLKFAEKKDYDFFIGFSSVAARFGNEGQIDYSGGNEMLGKLIHGEKIKHPERMYKVFDWTAWSGAGMAMNETVKKVLEMRGTVFLPLERGIEFFMNELKDTATTEAIFAGMDDSFSAGQTGADSSVVAPFLDSVLHKDGISARFVRTITLERDLFMSDHTKDGIPLFLGATGVETMAEAAAQLAGTGKLVTELRDFHIPYGIKILKGRPKEIIIDTEKDGDAYKCSITSQFKNPRGAIVGDTTLHYKGTYLFGDKLPKQPVIAVPEENRIEYEGDFQEIIYHPERLFMDGVFRTVQNIRYFDGSLLVSAMKHNVSGREFFAGISRPDFLLDVVLLDAMFQTGGIYEMLSEQVVVLPYMINSMKVYARPEYGNDYLCLTRKISSNDETNVYSLQLIDMQGRVYVDIERFDMVRVTKFRKDQRIDNVIRVIA